MREEGEREGVALPGAARGLDQHALGVVHRVERGPVQEMPFFIDLLDVLHEADLPVPTRCVPLTAWPCVN